MMRMMMKGTLLLAIGAAFAAPGAVAAQEAEVTANAGWVSQYYYRGIMQKTSSASAGLDVAIESFGIGAWAADVGDGAEIDLYAGAGFDITETVSLSLGGTGYFYTGQFDNTYLEANVGLGFGPVSIEYSFGSYRTDPDPADYSFLAVTAEHEGLFATVGTFGSDLVLKDAFDKDASPQYLEAGYGFSAMDLDFLISGIWNDSLVSGEVNGDGDPTHELTLVFGVSKTFALN